MKRFIVQIYEIQTPDEAEALIGLGVDHIGSVLVSESEWKNPLLKETIRRVARSSSQSSLIPLFSTPKSVFQVLEYYQTDIMHFCDSIAARNGIYYGCKSLIELQMGKKEMPGNQLSNQMK